MMKDSMRGSFKAPEKALTPPSEVSLTRAVEEAERLVRRLTLIESSLMTAVGVVEERLCGSGENSVSQKLTDSRHNPTEAPGSPGLMYTLHRAHQAIDWLESMLDALSSKL